MPTNNPIKREPDGSLSTASIKTIEKDLYEALDQYSIKEFPSEHRNHLGVSLIGHKCSRYLWYGFRWAKLEQHQPRMRRLFQRGHSEEEKFRKLLLWMGFYVREIDPNTNKQYRFSAINGHYGGSGDSVGLLPDIRDEDFRILIEYKTHNKKSFDKLKADKLKASKPQHYAQMCGYGYAFKLKYGLYCAINKDDDDIYFEFVELDWNYAIQLEKKAADVIGSQIPLPRISDNPAWHECKYCNFNEICHSGAAVEINCRSCNHAVPIENGEWHCGLWNATIPKEEIKNGCPQHQSINI